MGISITVGLQKGGVAKSTTAIFLGLAAHRDTGGRVLIVDADPRSQTAYTWKGFAEDEWPEGVVVIPWPTLDVDRSVRAVAQDYEHIIIDTGGDNPEILARSLRATRSLLMPLAPNAAEYTRAAATVELARGVAATWNPDLTYKVAFVRTGGGQDADVRRMRLFFDEHGVPYAETRIRQRKMYSRAFGTSVPDLGEYADLYKELATEE